MAGRDEGCAHFAHRRDIDGLRALAILPVIAFHAKLGVTGGCAGVDVFFVISGYLITRLVEERLERGEFSVRDFNYRRIKRIFPALLMNRAQDSTF